jgi:hypothetical protein
MSWCTIKGWSILAFILIGHHCHLIVSAINNHSCQITAKLIQKIWKNKTYIYKKRENKLLEPTWATMSNIQAKSWDRGHPIERKKKVEVQFQINPI